MPAETRRFKIASKQIKGADGAEFEVACDATEEEIATAAFDAVAEHLDYGWEEIDG
jgi:hypothetical protein